MEKLIFVDDKKHLTWIIAKTKDLWRCSSRNETRSRQCTDNSVRFDGSIALYPYRHDSVTWKELGTLFKRFRGSFPSSAIFKLVFPSMDSQISTLKRIRGKGGRRIVDKSMESGYREEIRYSMVLLRVFNEIFVIFRGCDFFLFFLPFARYRSTDERYFYGNVADSVYRFHPRR